MRRRWVKFKGRAPRFCDPAEASFTLRLWSGIEVTGCYWGQCTARLITGTATASRSKPVVERVVYVGFFRPDGTPVCKDDITNYRRE